MCATCQAVYREKGFCFLNHTCGKHAKADGKKNGETTCPVMPVFINRDHKLLSATSSEPVMAQERSRKHPTWRSSESQFLWGRLLVPIISPKAGRSSVSGKLNGFANSHIVLVVFDSHIHTCSYAQTCTFHSPTCSRKNGSESLSGPSDLFKFFPLISSQRVCEGRRLKVGLEGDRHCNVGTSVPYCPLLSIW